MQQVFSAAKRCRLREARERRQLTLESLAKESGYAVSTISSVENGHHNPSPRFVSRIAEVLGVRAEWIETGEGELINTGQPSTRVWTPIVDNYVEHMAEVADKLRDWAAEINAEAEGLDKHARDYEDFMRWRAWQNAAAAFAAAEDGREKTSESALTHTATAVTSVDVKAQLPILLEDLRQATAAPGKKTELAKFLGAPLASVSRWLAGEREPGGETVLKMQAWLKRQT